MSERHDDGTQSTLHMAPAEVWTPQSESPIYTPEAYDRDGFIHCTDGEDNLLRVANRFYLADPRDFAVLTIDRALVSAPVRYDDPERIYPHIYGPLNTNAVVAERRFLRTIDGRFVGIVEV